MSISAVLYLVDSRFTRSPEEWVRWDFSWSYSVHPCKCWDSYLKQAMNTTFHIFSNCSLIVTLLFNSIQWGMINWTVFINKITMIQQTQMLQRKRGNTTERHSMSVCMMCWDFSRWVGMMTPLFPPLCDFLWFLLGKVGSQFSLRKGCLCFSKLHVQCIKVK